MRIWRVKGRGRTVVQINEKPRKRQFTLELDEDEVAELITWADNPADDFVRGETGDALLRTLRRALSGPTRKSEGDNAGEPAKRSRTRSGVQTETDLDHQHGKVLVWEGQSWVERD